MVWRFSFRKPSFTYTIQNVFFPPSYVRRWFWICDAIFSSNIIIWAQLLSWYFSILGTVWYLGSILGTWQQKTQKIRHLLQPPPVQNAALPITNFKAWEPLGCWWGKQAAADYRSIPWAQHTLVTVRRCCVSRALLLGSRATLTSSPQIQSRISIEILKRKLIIYFKNSFAAALQWINYFFSFSSYSFLSLANDQVGSKGSQ